MLNDKFLTCDRWSWSWQEEVQRLFAIGVCCLMLMSTVNCQVFVYCLLSTVYSPVRWDSADAAIIGHCREKMKLLTANHWTAATGQEHPKRRKWWENQSAVLFLLVFLITSVCVSVCCTLFCEPVSYYIIMMSWRFWVTPMGGIHSQMNMSCTKIHSDDALALQLSRKHWDTNCAYMWNIENLTFWLFGCASPKIESPNH